ncbi:hypothetical protein ACFXP3_38925, partial [Streptomyces sp. NPDC059096]|uniref:hypothetical protein n=1 Tax=Streptomyces sp. NPDC059096 TaxID=3346727 RepID=UPI0036B0B236
RFSTGRGINISGVDFWHAVEFSRNGRFLRTHPQNILWGFPPGFPFGISCFKLYQVFFDFLTTVPQACKSGVRMTIKA